MRRQIILVAVLIFASILALAQNDKNQKKLDAYQAVLAIVESGNFEFVARKANPQGGRQIDLTTNPNYLRVRGNAGEADMPYFGRAFSGGYGTGSGGIEFNGEFSEYNIEKNDAKFKVIIEFKIKADSDTYKGTFTITGVENASISVSSNTKQVINYTGYIKELLEN